ncbi:MAG: MFS transporter [Legionella sp. 21-45-4]|nr:MAG: MFS transporter [Legionella sp. 21-45-4]
MHLPIGICLDRVGPRKVMAVCTLLTVIGLMPILFSTNWIYPLIGRGLIGIGSSAAILGTFKIIRMSFKAKHFTRMLSLSVTIGLLGAIYGGGPVSFLCGLYGYKTVVALFAGLGLLLASLTYLCIPDMSSETPNGAILPDIKTVLTNPRVILLCLLSGLMVGPMEGFADVWGAAFLKASYAFDANVATSLPSMIFIGMCFGAPLLSMIAEKTGYYLGTIILSGIIMCTVFALLLTHQLNTESIGLSFTLVGICSAYQILAIYKASTYVPEHVVGLTTAIANMIIMSFGYAFHSTIGLVIHHYHALNPQLAFTYGISVIPVTLFVGSLGFLAMAYFEHQDKFENNALELSK